MNDITLEQELQARAFMHKVAIVGGVLMNAYIQANCNGISLPPSIIEQHADEYSNKVIRYAIEHGTFESLYNNSWNSIKDNIPDDLNLCKV
jgi:hypothetical protein